MGEPRPRRRQRHCQLSTTPALVLKLHTAQQCGSDGSARIVKPKAILSTNLLLLEFSIKIISDSTLQDFFF
jgi:hypothetical protein